MNFTYHGGLDMMSVEEAITLMERSSELPTIEDYTKVIHNCRKLKRSRCALRLYSLLCGHGLENHKAMGNYVIPVFTSCGSAHQAQRIFSRFPYLNEHSWTSLIQCYVDCGDSQTALNVFDAMEETSPMHPSRYTFAAVLQACARLKCIEKGQNVHAAIVTEEFEGDAFLVSALVDMYAKCGLLLEAQDVFDSSPYNDVVCWTALMTGYAEQGLGEEAWSCLEKMQLVGISLDVVVWNAVIMAYGEQGDTDKALKSYEKMQEQGIVPNRVSFLNISKACCNKSAQRAGIQIHARLHHLVGSEIALVTAFVDMYAKCGRMDLAQELFDSMPIKSLVTWNALITGYVHQGDSEHVFHLFDRMREEGVKPDSITFLSVLNICCHGGFLTRGQMYFQSMQREYGIVPSMRHYNCMIDLLGRLGRLNEAVTMMEQIPSGPNYVTWASLLGACQKLADVEFCKGAFEHVVKLKLDDGQAFVLMSNICADVHEWEQTKRFGTTQGVSLVSGE
ncbi:hypothetical protein KP509_21G047600 [Ceratopteris richardii]|uniref:Pentatricopeptide repeat-containing protein n=1 Tax=Ceratopteris richardii TaxID=49495 RepID=A0A8T2S9L5_CERRI|nr:hypothetical protein KP509_21G047600 [Ceratopteris richardii]